MKLRDSVVFSIVQTIFSTFDVNFAHCSAHRLCYPKHKGYGKVVPVPFFNSAPRQEGVLGERNCSSSHSLTSALDGDEWSASRPGRFTPMEKPPCTHWVGGCVGSSAVLDTVVKRKIPCSRRESNLRTPTVQPVAQYYAILYRLISKDVKIKIYKTVILPAVLCGCITLFLTLKD
jgi:hypothetical protein